ncbi:MAG: zinc ribbon domain-containing protein [Methanomassiliicoccus sp.]|nr:zinc ribbon domain-containing protein [Methanomassiliicoccus sp.]
MSTLDDLKDRFLKFRANKYAVYVGLALTFIVCTLLLLYSSYLLCFGILLVAVAGYYIPVLFGLKSRKKLAVWGVVLIVLLAVPYTMFIIAQEKNAENIKLSTANGSMTNGTVTPFYGNDTTVHVFSVEVTNSTYSNVRVVVYDVQTSSVVVNATMEGNTSTNDGLFTYETTLANKSSYGYWFAADTNDGFKATSSNYGPLHADDTALFVYWFPLIIFALFIEIGVLYFLLLIMGYWMERTRARAADKQMQQGPSDTLPPAKGGKEEKFVCSECGAEVPSSAQRCPQCGERFDEPKDAKPKSKKEEFVCTECGAAVDENAKTCWNCGKEFEN